MIRIILISLVLALTGCFNAGPYDTLSRFEVYKEDKVPPREFWGGDYAIFKLTGEKVMIIMYIRGPDNLWYYNIRTQDLREVKYVRHYELEKLK